MNKTSKFCTENAELLAFIFVLLIEKKCNLIEIKDLSAKVRKSF